MPKTNESPRKIDLFKELKEEYAAPKNPRLVRTTTGKYLAVEGRGAPGGESYVEAIGALYAAAYTLKFDSKAAGKDYTVGKLEAIYWTDGPEGAFAATPKEQWCWRLLIRVPPHETKRRLTAAAKRIREKGKCAGIDRVTLETLREGRCAQVLHVGPFERSGESVARLEEFMAGEGLTRAGRHHEIYLSDPRRVEPERLKTILRVPVR